MSRFGAWWAICRRLAAWPSDKTDLTVRVWQIAENQAKFPKRTKGHTMAQVTVFQFIAGITEESDYSDEQCRIGTMELFPSRKARTERIVWMQTDRFEYIETDKLRKVDKDLYVLDIAWDGYESGHLPHTVQRMRDLAQLGQTRNKQA